MRSAPAATLLALALLGAVAVGALAVGRGHPTAAVPERGGATLAPAPTRMLDDARFALTFRYPSELRPVVPQLRDGKDRGKRIAAVTALYAPRLGFFELTRIDDDLPSPALDRDAPWLSRAVARLLRAGNPELAFRVTPHVVHDLPVVLSRVTNDLDGEVILNVFTWVGRDAYRLVCHERTDPARRAEMQRACLAAMRSLAVRPAVAAAPGATRAS